MVIEAMAKPMSEKERDARAAHRERKARGILTQMAKMVEDENSERDARAQASTTS